MQVTGRYNAMQGGLWDANGWKHTSVVQAKDSYVPFLGLHPFKDTAYEHVAWSKWTNIQWPDIYTYLVEKPSVYTSEKLANKSLDAYNYVTCGYVQNIKDHDTDSGFWVLKSEILPSQRQRHKTTMNEV